jgi:hypothetical protein
MHDVTHLSSPHPHLSTCEATSTATTPSRTFAYLWARSGAPALVGYEASLLVTLARTDGPMYDQLTAIDLDDPEAVLDAVAVIQNWRRDVAAGTSSVSFGPRTRRLAEVDAVGVTQLPDAA